MALDILTMAVAKSGAISASKTYTDGKVAGIESGLDYKGSVATVADLPTDATKGDEYTVIAANGTYAYDGTTWHPAGVQGIQGPQGEPGQSGAYTAGTYISISNNTINNTMEIVDNVNSSSSTKTLSAKQGKLLDARITNLQNMGRFLAIWNSTTGEATSDPTTSPYSYRTGDYYRIGTVGNRIPDGSSYTIGGTNYTTTTETLTIGDVYYYDGTVWRRQAAGAGGTVQDVQIDGTSILSGGVADFDSEAFTFTLANGTTVTKNILVKE